MGKKRRRKKKRKLTPPRQRPHATQKEEASLQESPSLDEGEFAWIHAWLDEYDLDAKRYVAPDKATWAAPIRDKHPLQIIALNLLYFGSELSVTNIISRLDIGCRPTEVRGLLPLLFFGDETCEETGARLVQDVTSSGSRPSIKERTLPLPTCSDPTCTVHNPELAILAAKRRIIRRIAESEIQHAQPIADVHAVDLIWLYCALEVSHQHVTVETLRSVSKLTRQEADQHIERMRYTLLLRLDPSQEDNFTYDADENGERRLKFYPAYAHHLVNITDAQGHHLEHGDLLEPGRFARLITEAKHDAEHTGTLLAALHVSVLRNLMEHYLETEFGFSTAQAMPEIRAFFEPLIHSYSLSKLISLSWHAKRELAQRRQIRKVRFEEAAEMMPEVLASSLSTLEGLNWPYEYDVTKRDSSTLYRLMCELLFGLDYKQADHLVYPSNVAAYLLLNSAEETDNPPQLMRASLVEWSTSVDALRTAISSCADNPDHGLEGVYREVHAMRMLDQCTWIDDGIAGYTRHRLDRAGLEHRPVDQPLDRDREELWTIQTIATEVPIILAHDPNDREQQGEDVLEIEGLPDLHHASGLVLVGSALTLDAANALDRKISSGGLDTLVISTGFIEPGAVSKLSSGRFTEATEVNISLFTPQRYSPSVDDVHALAIGADGTSKSMSLALGALPLQIEPEAISSLTRSWSKTTADISLELQGAITQWDQVEATPCPAISSLKLEALSLDANALEVCFEWFVAASLTTLKLEYVTLTMPPWKGASKEPIEFPRLLELSLVGLDLLAEDESTPDEELTVSMPALVRLTLTDTPLSPEGMRALGQAIASSKELTFLSIRGSSSTGKGLAALFAQLRQTSRLKFLALDAETLEFEQVRDLLNRPCMAHLKSIRLYGCNLTGAITAIARSPFLEKLAHLTLPNQLSLEDKQEAQLILSRSPYLNNVKLGLATTPQ